MRKKNNAYVFILVAASLSSVGQLFWKFATTPSISVWLIVLLMAVGFLSAGLGLLFETVAFRYGQVSILQPMMSFSFILSIILGAVFLNEAITFQKILAIIFIALGCALISTSKEEE